MKCFIIESRREELLRSMLDKLTEYAGKLKFECVGRNSDRLFIYVPEEKEKDVSAIIQTILLEQLYTNANPAADIAA